MVAQIFLVVFLITAISISSIESSAQSLRARILRSTNANATQVVNAASQQALQQIRNQIRLGIDPSALPVPIYMPVNLCPPRPASPCQHTSSASFAYTGNTTSIVGGAAAPALALNLNTTDKEGRVSLIETATLTDGGKQVASRRQLVTFQTLNAAPYATIVGTLDYNGSANAESEGDTAGCDPNNSTACDPKSSITADDTRVKNVQGTCVGNPTECSFATPPPTVNAYATKPWSSTDIQAPVGGR